MTTDRRRRASPASRRPARCRPPPAATSRSWPPLALLLVMYGIGVARYDGFSDGQVVLNVFIDNALPARRRRRHDVRDPDRRHRPVGRRGRRADHDDRRRRCWRAGWPPLVVLPLVLLIGALLGFAMGCVIHYFEIQPFIVTLAGMFLARGLCYVISTDVDPDHRPVLDVDGARPDPRSAASSSRPSVVIAARRGAGRGARAGLHPARPQRLRDRRQRSSRRC